MSQYNDRENVKNISHDDTNSVENKLKGENALWTCDTTKRDKYRTSVKKPWKANDDKIQSAL